MSRTSTNPRQRQRYERAATIVKRVRRRMKRLARKPQRSTSDKHEPRAHHDHNHGHRCSMEGALWATR
jgi:hypothetical protein